MKTGPGPFSAGSVLDYSAQRALDGLGGKTVFDLCSVH